MTVVGSDTYAAPPISSSKFAGHSFFFSCDPFLFLSSRYAKQVQHDKEESGEVQLK
jgi:hypothetical protein